MTSNHKSFTAAAPENLQIMAKQHNGIMSSTLRALLLEPPVAVPYGIMPKPVHEMHGWPIQR